MSLVANPVVGTIRIEPPADSSLSRLVSDDSTLEAVLASFAASESLAETEEYLLVASTRVTRQIFPARLPANAVSADVARLLAELQAEFDQLPTRSAT